LVRFGLSSWALGERAISKPTLSVNSNNSQLFSSLSHLPVCALSHCTFFSAESITPPLTCPPVHDLSTHALIEGFAAYSIVLSLPSLPIRFETPLLSRLTSPVLLDQPVHSVCDN
jgi:hypothetical protein